MQPSNKNMVRLCNEISREVGDGTTNQKLSKYESFIMSKVTRPWVHRQWTLRRSVQIAVAIIGILLGAVLLWPSPKEMRFSIDGTEDSVQNRGWITGTANRTIPISFENGSQVIVQKNASVRVRNAGEDAVNIDLQRGALHAQIQGNGHTRWSVHVGPFRVVVLGTTFTVSWRANMGVLDVKVVEGTVMVKGLDISENGVRVTTGHHLRVNENTGFLALNSISPLKKAEQTMADDAAEVRVAQRSASPLLVASSPSVKDVETENKKKSIKEAMTGAPKSSPTRSIQSDKPWRQSAEPSHVEAPKPSDVETVLPRKVESPAWISDYEKRQYETALKKAEDVGIDKLKHSLAPEHLWMLMHCARNTGKAALAREIILVFRARYPESKKAKMAAFLLGKIANDSSQASHWFHVYLSEAPNGPLAEEALGRLMILHHREGEFKASVREAKRYILQHPNGPFAEIARSIAAQ